MVILWFHRILWSNTYERLVAFFNAQNTRLLKKAVATETFVITSFTRSIQTKVASLVTRTDIEEETQGLLFCEV